MTARTLFKPLKPKEDLRGISIEKINEDGTVVVSVEEYKRIKKLLRELIREIKIDIPYYILSKNVEDWYKEQLEWDKVWRISDIIKKLTDEEYALLEKHILEQKEN